MPSVQDPVWADEPRKVFDGWYILGGTVYSKLNSGTQITRNLTLYAKWTACETDDECVVPTEVAPTYERQPDLDIYFVVGNGATERYTLMDRNL